MSYERGQPTLRSYDAENLNIVLSDARVGVLFIACRQLDNPLAHGAFLGVSPTRWRDRGFRPLPKTLLSFNIPACCAIFGPGQHTPKRSQKPAKRPKIRRPYQRAYACNTISKQEIQIRYRFTRAEAPAQCRRRHQQPAWRLMPPFSADGCKIALNETDISRHPRLTCGHREQSPVE